MDVSALAPLFAAPAPPARPGWGDRVKAAASVEELDAIERDADAAVTAGDLTENQRNTLGNAIAKLRETMEVPA